MKTIALVVRATVNATGAITFTGNTLGLSRSAVAGVPGTVDSIGAFTTINTAVRYGTYPLGTTSQYTSNSSSAILVLPAGSTVLYAELIWGGTYLVDTVNLTSAINNPVSLTTPTGTFSIYPDSATANEFDLGSGSLGYTRSANVTTLVQQGGAGTYTTGGVVGTIIVTDPTVNHAGWTLGVLYQNPALPFRNMSLRAGAVLVQATSGPVTTTLTGFATPISGTLGGRALFSAQEGDANRTGDQALFGPTTSSQTALSGPNNFANNFFASQINNDLGQLDTTGTFGSRNQTNGAPGTNISGGRQGWDITNVDISARLINNQSSAVLTLTTSGDAYVVNANAIQIDINAPKINVVKSASASGSVVGDTITYSVTVSNTGTANAASVVLSDILPASTSFVTGSVTVAGVARPTYSVLAGIPLGALALNSSIIVTYQAKVVSLPSPQTVANQANAAFTFQSVAGGPTISGVIPSNTVTLPVYAPVLTIAKSADTVNATVGDTITYTLSIANNGNIAATTTITDNIPPGSSFVAGSFRINGSAVPGANPASGVALGAIAAGTATTVTFQTLVNSLPAPATLTDLASAAYTYTVPDGRTFNGSALSNSLTIPVTLPNVAAAKSVSAASAVVGDTVTYTVTIANNGVTAISNVVLTDPIPAGSSLVAGSVNVGGAPRPAADPASGIALGTLAAAASVAVTFQIKINALPSPAQITNQASISYSSGAFNGIALSNSVSAPVFQPVITIVKSAGVAQAIVGDTVVYTLTVSNSGNLAATGIVFDNIPAGTSFVAGSVTVNGASVPGASPTAGISTGVVAAGASAVVRFSVVVDSLPNPPSLSNTGLVNYAYTAPDGRNLAGSSTSNTVNIPVSAPNVTLVKSASLANAALNDVIVYTVVATNSGAAAVSNVRLTDPIPAGTQLVSGSVLVGGVPQPGADPASGIALSSIAAGGSVTVTFSLKIVSVPTPPQLANRASISFTSGAFSGTSLSNTVTTPIYQPIVSVVKSASSQAPTVGDTLAYKLDISNSGNYPAYITVTDNIPGGTTFTTNSAIVGSSPQPGTSPLSGITVGTLAPGESVTVSFAVTIDALPATQRLVNTAAAAYAFTLPGGRQISGSAASNTLTLPVSAPNVTVVESTTAVDAVAGDRLIYTAIVTNRGGSPVNQLVFTGILDANTTFIPGSVIVNGAAAPSANPASGIPIGSLAPNASTVVTYEVKLTMPTTPQVTNQSTVSFTSGTFSGTSSSNILVTPVYQPNIALLKSASTANATLGDTIIYTIHVSNTGNIAAFVSVTDPIPAGTTFITNSVTVNGTPQPGADPAAGMAAGSLAPGASAVVTFSVLLVSLPTPQTLNNQAVANFAFNPPDGRTVTGTALSNTLTLMASAPNVSIVKSTTRSVTTVGDTVPYTLAVTNAGIEDVTSVVVNDMLPDSTVFVHGSVSVNGSPVPGADPAAGIQIGTITPGSTVTVAFSVSVTTLPLSGQLSNQASVSYASGAFSTISFSDPVVTPVLQPIVAVAKTANTANATLGDTIVYTLTVQNTGNYAALVAVSDTIPTGTTFVPNSVIVNGSPQPGATPDTSVTVGPLAAGASATVMFSVVLSTLPSPQQLTNQGVALYTFTLPDSRSFNRTALSNTVVIPASAPNITLVKSAPVSDAVVGDTFTYSVVVTNSGITNLTNVVFSDPLPAGVAFVPGSITVDGTPRPSGLLTGLSLGTLLPGASTTVAFGVLVTTLPNPAVLNNQASVSFTNGAFSSVSFSNTLSTPVYQPVINVGKSANTANATVGDTIVYTLTVANTGNWAALVTLTDSIPAGASFVPNSVVVNGAPQPGADPISGFSIGTLAPGSAATVTLQATVVSLPTPQTLINQASASFTFSPPDGRTLTGNAQSNSVTIPVSSPNVSVVKSANVADAVFGDSFAYTLVVTNNGIQPISSVVLTDAIPQGATFQPGSVVVDGIARPGANPATGITLGTLAAGGSSTVNFNITVSAGAAPVPLANQASVSFTSGAFSGIAYSNTLTTPVYQPILQVVKSANTVNATVGDTIVYSLAVTNTGNLSAVVTLTDSIPAGSTFVPNSVVVNGMSQPGADPTAGIGIGTVAPGSTVTVTVTLQVNVTSLPASQLLVNQASANFTFSPPDGRSLSGSAASNTVTIPVSSPDVSVVKTASALDAVKGDTITYTIVVTNLGIAAVNNVVMVDPVPAGTAFVAGSVTVDAAARPTDNPNIGITIGTLAAGAASTITFQVTVS
ncbi:DUF11 domain-containing protein [Paenibacillus athensensis]|nr:DUF11 domain-containing protein [Paenibacillus athensensis]